MGEPHGLRDDAERLGNRRMMVVAVGLMVLMVGMWSIGTWWSFLIGLAATVVATEWDRRARPAAHQVPLWAFLASIFVTLFLVAVVALFVVLVIMDPVP